MQPGTEESSESLLDGPIFLERKGGIDKIARRFSIDALLDEKAVREKEKEILQSDEEDSGQEGEDMGEEKAQYLRVESILQRGNTLVETDHHIRLWSIFPTPVTLPTPTSSSPHLLYSILTQVDHKMIIAQILASGSIGHIQHWAMLFLRNYYDDRGSDTILVESVLLGLEKLGMTYQVSFLTKECYMNYEPNLFGNRLWMAKVKALVEIWIGCLQQGNIEDEVIYYRALTTSCCLLLDYRLEGIRKPILLCIQLLLSSLDSEDIYLESIPRIIAELVALGPNHYIAELCRLLPSHDYHLLTLQLSLTKHIIGKVPISITMPPSSHGYLQLDEILDILKQLEGLVSSAPTNDLITMLLGIDIALQVTFLVPFSEDASATLQAISVLLSKLNSQIRDMRGLNMTVTRIKDILTSTSSKLIYYDNALRAQHCRSPGT